MASPIQMTNTEQVLKTTTGQVILKIIKLVGQLDESNVDETARQIYDLIETFPQQSVLLFDMQELSYLNSKTIGYLTDWHLKMSEKQGKLALVGLRPNILDILNVVGLTQIVSNYDTLDAAKEAMAA